MHCQIKEYNTTNGPVKSNLSLTKPLDLAFNFLERLKPEEHGELHDGFAIYSLDWGIYYELNDLHLSIIKLFSVE